MFFRIILLTILINALGYFNIAYALPANLLHTGDEVTLEEGADDPTVALGWAVFVKGGVYTKMLLAAGAEVTLAPKNASGKVYAFGQQVHVAGTYSGPVALVGQDITLGKKSTLEHEYWLSGRRVLLEGEILAQGKILAQRVVVNGHVTASAEGKTLDIQATELEIGPNAVIEGNIIYRGKTPPRVVKGAVLTGTLSEETDRFEDELRTQAKKVAIVGKWGSKIMLFVWLLIAGFVVSIFMAPKMVASLKRVRKAPAKMLCLGFAYALLVPVGAIFAIASVVGMPVGISLIAGYPLVVISGFSIGVLWCGMLLYFKIWRRYPQKRHELMLAYVLAMPLVVLVTQLPYIGVFGWLVPLCAGLGALSWLKWQQMQAGKE